MAITNFNQLLNHLKKTKPLKLSIALPHNEHILNSLFLAAKSELIIPYITGSKTIIESIAKDHNIDLKLFNVKFLESDQCLPYSIDLVKNGTCNALMKGDSTTASIMSLVLKKENNLRTNKIISHTFVLQLPRYHKLLFITDAAINIAPNIQDKIKITNSTIDLANSLEINTPKIAVLSAIETVNPKMSSTIDASKLANNLQLKSRALIEGPLAFDCAINQEAASIKKLQSEVSGDVDIVVVPNIESGNILFKSLIYLADAKSAGLVLGAKIPIILTSRSDSTESKLLSIALASIHINNKENI